VRGLLFAEKLGGAVVAGASGALGAACARRLAAEGAAVVVGYRSNREAAEEVARAIRGSGGVADPLSLDLAEPDEVSRALDEAEARFGGIHTVVYAAGPDVPMLHLSRIEPAALRAQLEGDAVAFANLLHAAVPHLRKTRGALVALTTAGTSRVMVRDALSAAPKAAVEALVRQTAVEEGRYGVRANSVGVGMTRDGMAARLIESGGFDQHALDVITDSIPLRRFGTADEVAHAVCFLASDLAGFTTGQILNVDGGFSV
jgi:NAD(P)-dependent dehydrogenase (short-subunit alcohol dehydrogenase family)